MRVYKRDQFICQLQLLPACLGDMRWRYEKYMNGQMTRKRAGYTIDHKRPQSKGGKWELENLQCACMYCNQAKGSLSTAEVAALLTDN